MASKHYTFTQGCVLHGQIPTDLLCSLPMARLLQCHTSSASIRSASQMLPYLPIMLEKVACVTGGIRKLWEAGVATVIAWGLVCHEALSGC